MLDKVKLMAVSKGNDLVVVTLQLLTTGAVAGRGSWVTAVAEG